MRLYISGPMTGIEDYNFPAFNAAAADLTAAGYDVENPADKGLIEGWDWEDYLRYDIKQLMDCDGIAMLRGWNSSRGARLERDVAEGLGMPYRLLNAWLSDEARERHLGHARAWLAAAL